LAALFDHIYDEGGGFGVKSDGRFIEEQDRWSESERRAQSHKAATSEIEEHGMLMPLSVEMEELDDGPDALVAHVLGKAEVTRSNPQFIEN
jgi:hypothetical protein